MPDSPPIPWAPRSRIRIDLDLPIEQRFAVIPDDLLTASKTLLDATLAAIGDHGAGIAELVDARTEGRWRAESEALAGALGTEWQRVMLANASYDFMLSAFGCSTAAIDAPAGPVLFRNMDWWPEDLLARGSCVLDYQRGGVSRFEVAGWAAASGAVSGLSHRGFAVALNAVSSPEPVNLEGYPVLLHLRRVFEDATGFDDAVRMLTETPLVAGGLFTVVGTDVDQRVVIERSQTRAELRHARGTEPLIATNDYRAFEAAADAGGGELHASACSRFDALTAEAENHLPSDPSDTRLLAALSHPDVRMGITAQHVIARPRQGSLRLFVPSRLLATE